MYILRQGTRGDTFYLISQGEVKVTQTLPGHEVDDTIRVLGRGDYFGEQALLKEDKRTANIIAMQPGVECLTLDRESFTRLIGDLSELHERDYGDESRMALRNSTANTMDIFEKVDVKKGWYISIHPYIPYSIFNIWKVWFCLNYILKIEFLSERINKQIWSGDEERA